MQIGKNKEVIDDSNDWAVLPFDEAEDEERWTKLIEETDNLIAETQDLEANHGEILMENKLSEINSSQKEAEDEVF